MKRLYLIPLLLTIFNTSRAQEFCGVIRYQHTYYKGKAKKDVTGKVKNFKTEDFYVCGNRIKTCFDGKVQDILIGDSLTYFLLRTDSIAGYVKANSAYGEKLPTYGEIKSGVVYNGKTYKTIEANSKGESITYYFNDEIKINPDLFSGVEINYWNKYFAATKGSLRLVAISKKGRLTRISEATEIIEMSLTDSDFLVPSGFRIEPWDNFKVYN